MAAGIRPESGLLRSGALLGVALSGFVALALVGNVTAAAAGLGIAFLLGAPIARLASTRFPWSLSTVVVVGSLFGWVGFGGPPASALGVLLAYLQVHNRITRVSDADDRGAVLLSALMLVISAGVEGDPAFAAAALGFMLCAPLALSSGLGPIAAVSISAVHGLLALVLFVAAPRGIPPSNRVALTGFSDDVAIGSLDALFDDPAVVFRAAIRPPVQGVVYWRGIALDRFDGRRWSNGSTSVRTVIQSASTFPTDAVVVDVEPEQSGVLFLVGWPLDVDVGSAVLSADGQNGWSAEGALPRYRFVAQLPAGPADRAFTPPEPDPAALARALALPDDLDPRIVSLAQQVAEQGSAIDRVGRIAAYLRQNHGYTRRPQDADAEAPLASFLFDQRTGHCEYFATALAVLARGVGIPARVVNGFVGGDGDPATGWVTLRRRHAHAWVEVHDGGWWLVDATPGPAASVLPAAVRPPVSVRLQQAWDWIVQYDRSDQVEAMVGAGRWAESLVDIESRRLPWRGLAALAGVAAAFALVGAAVGRRVAGRLLDPPLARPRGRVARIHARARTHVARCGLVPPGALPPAAAAGWVVARCDGEAARALQSLAWLYYEVHLGGVPEADVVSRARQLLAIVETLRPEAR